MPKSRKSRVTINRPVLRITPDDLEALFEKDIKNFMYCMKLFEITNKAAFSTALALYQIEAELIPNDRFVRQFKKTIEGAYKGLLQQIREISG